MITKMECRSKQTETDLNCIAEIKTAFVWGAFNCVWNRRISKIPDQNGISRLHNRLEIYHFGTESSNYYQGFPTRMVYLYYMSCLRYTILVRNPRHVPIN